MKFTIAFLALVLGTGLASAQGTFVYDQQSTGAVDGSLSLNQTPLGQSFTPTLDAIDFLELQLINGVAASTFTVNLRSDSISGPILGTTAPVAYTSSGIYDFLFSNPVSLTPGTKYYFEPVVSSGGFAQTYITFIQYTGGDLIQSGVTRTDRDLWFREGIVSNVPEPSSMALFLLGGSALFWHRRNRGMT
jgi:hypothetical protein